MAKNQIFMIFREFFAYNFKETERDRPKPHLNESLVYAADMQFEQKFLKSPPGDL